mgnify:CR=1 FL=1
MMYIFITIILNALLTLSNVVSITANEKIEVEIKHVKKIKIDKDYSHQNLISNDRYIVWFEHYTHSFYISDLTSNNLKQIIIKKGRGPGESVLIKSAIIFKDDLLVYDIGLMKIMRFNLKSGSFINEFPTNLMLQSIISDGVELYGSGLSPNGFFFKYDFDSKKFIPFPNSNLPFLDRFNMADPSFNPFKIQGSYSLCDECIVFSSSFDPIFYIYSIKNQSLSQYKFESIPEVDYESGRIGNTLSPPSPLKMYIEKIVRINNQSIGVLARGKSDERDYSSNNVHIFNIINKSYVGNIQFPHEINDISVSDRYIITLSNEKWSIDVYEYRILN